MDIPISFLLSGGLDSDRYNLKKQMKKTLLIVIYLRPFNKMYERWNGSKTINDF